MITLRVLKNVCKNLFLIYRICDHDDLQVKNWTVCCLLPIVGLTVDVMLGVNGCGHVFLFTSFVTGN